MPTELRGDPPVFGELLRRLRVAAGLTQEALAERAGLSARGLSDLERGVRAAPRKDTLGLIVEALALSAADRAVLVAAARRGAVAAARPRSSSLKRGKGADIPFAAELPVAADSLIGREGEVAAVIQLFAEPSVRLVTLTGPGGVGKTRLALQIAAELGDEFPGGVAFVPLAAIRDPELVLGAVAQALGVRDIRGDPPEAALAIALRNRRVLLVLDNFEQVLDAAPAVARLLTACPDLHALVTSRAALRLTSEQRYLVPPLAAPGEDLAGNPALRLFVRRARQVRPDLALTPETAAAAAAICRRLDGLPLAIELAAARVGILLPLALLTRLERALPVLGGGARDQPARLQTMREAIGWSYGLLPSAGQSLFCWLAVFDGGFGLEAAAAVCHDCDDADAALMEGLAELVDASLLRAEEGEDGEPRFTMLETIREYGLEQLGANAEDERLARERHAAWVLAFAEHAQPQLFRAEQQIWWRRVETERPNARAALAWFEDIGDAARAQRLAGALVPFCWVVGRFQEVQDWLQRALAIPGNSSPAVRAWATMGLGSLAWFRGDNETSRELGEQALAIARDAEFVLGVGMSLLVLSETAMMAGDLERAVAVGEEAIARLREVADPGWLSIALNDAGTAALLSGDLERGEAWSAEGLALTRAAGNRWFTAIKLSDLGVVAHGEGDAPAAARHYAESVRLFHEMGDTWYIASPLAGLAAIAAARGHPKTAARLLGAAAALHEASGSTVWSTEQRRDEQAAAAARAALGEEGFAQALEAGRTLTIEHAVDEALAIAGGGVSAQPPPLP